MNQVELFGRPCVLTAFMGSETSSVMSSRIVFRFLIHSCWSSVCTLFGRNMSSETAALLEAVKDLKEDSLDKLVKELEQRPKNLDVYKKRTRDDWKELYGSSGIDVFNYLNPGNII